MSPFSGGRELASLPIMSWRGRVLALGAAGLLLAAGCSNTVQGDAAAGSQETSAGKPVAGQSEGLIAALGAVRSTRESRVAFTYGDIAAIRDLVEQDRSRFEPLSGWGWDALWIERENVKKGIDLDIDAMQEAFVAGLPPDWVGVIRGDYDVTAVEAKISARGATPKKDGEATTWVVDASQGIDYDGPFSDVVHTNEFNVTRTAPGSFAYSSGAAAMEWVAATQGETLADDPVTMAAANCLGDVVAAELYRPGDGPDVVYAVGVQVAAPDDVTEVVCMAPADGNAEQLRKTFEQRLPDAVGPEFDALRGAEAVVDGAVVRVQAPARKDRPVSDVRNFTTVRSLPDLMSE